MSSVHDNHHEEVYDEDVEEVEVTDDDEDEVEEIPVTETQSPAPGSPAPGTPAIKKVGKVVASPEVMAVKHATPETLAAAKVPAKASSTVNRLAAGVWTPETFKEVKIVYPVYSSKDETTNKLTRENGPEKRYWKQTLNFVDGTHRRETIVIKNVPIPYHDNPKYGVDFVYLCLPGFMADHFAECGKKRRPTVSGEKSIVPDSQRWWKVANKVADKFGPANSATKGFRPIPLAALFAGTNRGIICNVELRFSCKASTDNYSPLSASTPQTIAVEVVRGYIVATDQDIELPVRVQRNKETVKPVFSSDDYASDDVMKRLKSLGI